MLGLSLAYYLSKKGLKITVLERTDSLGGLASGIPVAGTTIEKYYHHWFKSDTDIQELITDLGLTNKLEWLPSKVGIYYKGKEHDFTTGLSLLRFSPLPMIDRLRTAVVSFYLQKKPDLGKLDQVAAYDWCLKYFGKNSTKVIWEPLLKGKFGDSYDKISMGWLWARIHDRSSSRENPFVAEKLGYLKGGFQSLVDRLAEKCRELGVEFKLNANILSHKYQQSHQLVYEHNGKQIKISPELIISTIPGPIFLKLFKIPNEYKQAIAKIEYLGASAVVLFIKKSFTPYYWLNINDLDFPFLVVVEHTNFVDSRLYGGRKILYIAKYLNPEMKQFKMEKDELIEYYLPYLRRLNENFSKEQIEESFLFKSAYAQHIVNKKYKVPPYETGIPGLYYANFTQVYPHDRGTNYSVAQAKQLIELILQK